MRFHEQLFWLTHLKVTIIFIMFSYLVSFIIKDYMLHNWHYISLQLIRSFIIKSTVLFSHASTIVCYTQSLVSLYTPAHRLNYLPSVSCENCDIIVKLNIIVYVYIYSNMNIIMYVNVLGRHLFETIFVFNSLFCSKIKMYFLIPRTIYVFPFNVHI